MAFYSPTRQPMTSTDFQFFVASTLLHTTRVLRGRRRDNSHDLPVFSDGFDQTWDVVAFRFDIHLQSTATHCL